MTFEEAVKQSIKKYYEGIDPAATMELLGEENPSEYGRDYFDSVEEEIFGEEVASDGEEEVKDA